MKHLSHLTGGRDVTKQSQRREASNNKNHLAYKPTVLTDLSSLRDLDVGQPAHNKVLVLVLGMHHNGGAELIRDSLRSVPPPETGLGVELTWNAR